MTENWSGQGVPPEGVAESDGEPKGRDWKATLGGAAFIAFWFVACVLVNDGNVLVGAVAFMILVGGVAVFALVLAGLSKALHSVQGEGLMAAAARWMGDWLESDGDGDGDDGGDGD